jgi:hypothetical protein
MQPMTRLEKRKEIDRVSRFVRAAETEINAMGILPRDPYKFPFDIVGLATRVKSLCSGESMYQSSAFRSARRSLRA